MASDPSYQDALRWRFHHSATEQRICSPPRVELFENEQSTVKMVVMHKPTNNPEARQSKTYPFSWHLAGKRRLWEIRLQMRFKKIPQGQMFFGIELDQYISLSLQTRLAQTALVTACQSVVGDCYHSKGDNPKKVDGEPEPPTFAMPLWAFDQFLVSQVGSEPDLLGDISTLGMRRSDDLNAYMDAMKETLLTLSTDNVYTFSFWGISQFLDVIQWEVSGGVLPMQIDFNDFCGTPPVHLVMYEMNGTDAKANTKHYRSKKTYFFRTAVWSQLKPPREGAFDEDDRAAAAAAAANAAAIATATSATSMAKPEPPRAEEIDLLGLSFDEPAPKPEAQASNTTASVDLLGLM
eukprot:TRINITY_DN54577_c0_g1_i1.p1 TRINITY_DN54577_c0_g1~~TRINITY_DN54577_c0_g1_i1.p1  ORF type:complete len:375 (-),score=79.84 TRINITY_DN54577_c0_g1_i1:113-1162(-)